MLISTHTNRKPIHPKLKTQLIKTLTLDQFHDPSSKFAWGGLDLVDTPTIKKEKKWERYNPHKLVTMFVNICGLKNVVMNIA